MALDSADKRFAAITISSPARGLGIFPSGSVDAEARIAILHFGAVPAAESVEEEFLSSGSAAGSAVSAIGTMGAIFLDDATPVPAGAVFLGGIAHDSAGMRYVALWPASESVVYRRGLACRHDGAMIIAPSGSIDAYVNAWAVTARGEVVVSTNDPDVIHSGCGLLSDGSLSLSETS